MKRFIILIIVGVVLAGTGSFLYQRSAAAEGQTVDVQENVNINTPTDTIITVEGTLIPAQSAQLSFEVNGQVAEVIVLEGTAVQAGGPLIRLQADQLELSVQAMEFAVDQAHANWAAAQAQLSVLQAGVTAAEWDVVAAQAQVDLLLAPSRPEEIAVAEANLAAAQAGVTQMSGNRNMTLNQITEAQVRSAEAQVAAAMANRNGLQEKYDHLIENSILGAPEEETRLQLAAAEAELAAAQAALDALNAGPTAVESAVANANVGIAAAQQEAAHAQLDWLQAPASAVQIQQAEEGVLQAQAKVAKAEVAVQQGEAVVAEAEAGLTQAQIALEAAQTALNQMTLSAPFSGVVAELAVEKGEIVMPGTAVVTLTDSQEWLIETQNLTELDVVSISVGKTVDVYLDALPDHAFQGELIEIAAGSHLVRGDVIYTALIRLDSNDADLPLRWGMSAYVAIER